MTQQTDSAAAARAYGAASVRVRGVWWKSLIGLWMVATILGAFLAVGPAPPFELGGHAAKIIFFHVPCAWLAALAYVVAAYYAARYLLQMRRRGAGAAIGEDLKCASAMELGLLFAVLATITGSIFSRLQWGAYWSWDPRQTSIVIVLLIFAAYIVLRGAIVDPDTRARLCSSYALVAVVPGLFLIWVLPRVVETLHSGPNRAVVGGGLKGHFPMVLMGLALPAFTALFVWMLQLRVRAMKLEARREADAS